MKGLSRGRAALWSVPVGLQLSLLYTLLLIATLALLGGALYAQLNRFLVEDTATRLEQVSGPLLVRPEILARGPAVGPRDPSRFGPPTSQVSYLERVSTTLVRGLSGPEVTVGVLDAQGQVLTATQALDESEPRTLPAPPAGWLDQLQTLPAAQWVEADPAGGRMLVLVQRLDAPAFGGIPGARLFVEQATSLAAADAVLNQLRLYLALGVLIGTLLGVPAGLALTRLVLRPLDRMARTAEAIAGGDLARRLRLPPGTNEVARLGRAFDDMVGRLATTVDAQRRFVADASHELRTPLTSLEGLSEMLLIGADQGDPRAVQRAVRAIHGELRRLSRLVTDLLTLSRLDSAAPLARQPVDLANLLGEVAAQMAPLAAAQSVRLAVAAPAPVVVPAERDRLKQVVLNLVDNALRYTPAGGEVCLRARPGPAPGQAQLQVEDSGSGIPPADLPHIFDRFYRGDLSRTRATGNSGLGLAIARTIVQAHGGEIGVQSAPGAGACFTVVLPQRA